MKPLASPVVEYRLTGVQEVAGGVALGVVAAAVQAPAGRAVVELVSAAALFGVVMYVLAYRRFARQVVQDPEAAPSQERERPGATRRRTALTTAALLVFLGAVALLMQTPALIGGIAAGNGAALIATSRWLREWEVVHSRTLLREPRWRWSREGARGWGRGRGLMDPQDFYVLASTGTRTASRHGFS